MNSEKPIRVDFTSTKSYDMAVELLKLHGMLRIVHGDHALDGLERAIEQGEDELKKLDPEMYKRYLSTIFRSVIGK